MPETIPPPSTTDELHARIDELRDGGRNTASAVRAILHDIVDAQTAPADVETEPEAAPAE